MSSADRYAAIVASKRAVFVDKALPDECAILRHGTAVTDSRGNVTYPEVTASTPRCRLKTQLSRPQEQEIANQVRATAPYAIDLGYDVDVTPSDVIQVAGRGRFEVVGVLKEGDFGIGTTAIVEERT